MTDELTDDLDVIRRGPAGYPGLTMRTYWLLPYDTACVRQAECLLARAEAAEAMLRRLEWHFGLNGWECPHCYKLKSQGHSANCELAALLKELKP